MASVVVVVGFLGEGGGGCYVLFEKDFFPFFAGKSVMSPLCTYYYMCMFV